MRTLEVLKPAGEVMVEVLELLAASRPELCDKSGAAFYPIPVVFPKILSRVVDTLQFEITRFHLEGDHALADLLTEARILLMQLVFEGDLGENHSRLFLDDHPASRTRKMDHPFKVFCEKVGTRIVT